MDDDGSAGMSGLRRGALPLGAWAAIASLIAGGLTLLAALLAGPWAGCIVVVLLGIGATAGGHWLGGQFERVRVRALAHLADGADGADGTGGTGGTGGTDASGAGIPGPRGLEELRRLDDALRALRLRIQLADEIAERHRRDADSAGTGMFELLSGLVAAEEGTRGQLAAELHDGVAQSLGAARRLLSDPQSADAWQQAAALVEDSEDALRATMARTRPPALRDGDLAAAVGLLRDDLGMRYGLEVTLEWPVVEYPLPLATAITIYRFFQEALLNVLKHADVDEAVASLSVEERMLTAVVRDSGPGFDMSRQPVAGAGGRHVGLGLLRERARLSGGSVDVMSAPGAGTMLTLRLPCPAAPPYWPLDPRSDSLRSPGSRSPLSDPIGQ